MVTVRRAEFSGSWYPGNQSDCQRVIEEFSRDSIPCPSDTGRAVGGIVPHAGWVFSGKIACNVIQCLNHQPEPDTCIIFGRHLHPSSDNFIMKEGRWATPLGELSIDSEVATLLSNEFPFTVETASRYEQDNTIELQLPFIKHFFPESKILPIGLPPRIASLEVAKKAANLCKGLGRHTIVLGSTDLTHYGYNYGFTPKGVGEEAVDWVRNENDRRVVDLMVEMDAEGLIREALRNHNACCSGAAAAAIVAAKELGSSVARKLVYATSYDVRPDSSFVGYAGIVFCA